MAIFANILNIIIYLMGFIPENAIFDMQIIDNRIFYLKSVLFGEYYAISVLFRPKMVIFCNDSWLWIILVTFMHITLRNKCITEKTAREFV